MYEGMIRARSDITNIYDELYLEYVKIYKNSTGEFSYSTPAIYISQKRENLTIEFPELGKETDNSKGES